MMDQVVKQTEEEKKKKRVRSYYLKKVKRKQEELQAEQKVQRELEEKNAVIITLTSMVDQVVKQADEKNKSLYEDFLINQTRQYCRHSSRLFLRRLNRFSPNNVPKQLVKKQAEEEKKRAMSYYHKKVKRKREELRAEQEVQRELEEKNAVLITLASMVDQVVKQSEEEKRIKKKSLYDDFLVNQTRQDCRHSPRLFLRRLNGFSPNYVYKGAWERKNEFLDYLKQEEEKKKMNYGRKLENTQMQNRTLKAYLKKFKTKREEKSKLNERRRAERKLQRELEKKKAVVIKLASIMDQVVKQAEEEKKKSLYDEFVINQTRQDCRQSPRLFLQRLNGFSPNYVSQSKISEWTRTKVLRNKAMLTPEEKEARNKMARLRRAEIKAAWTDEQWAFYKEKQRSYYYYKIGQKKKDQKYSERSKRSGIKLAKLRNQDIKQEKINETRRQVSKLSPQLSLQSKNGFSSNYTSQADFGVSPYMQNWYPENSTNILTDDVDVKYPELFNSFPNHCVSTASETTTSINDSTPNLKKETVPSVELGNSRSASKPATNISTIKIKEEPTSDLHCSASNCSPGSENSAPYSVFNNITKDSTSELYNSSTYPLTNTVENYYSEVYSEPVIDQNMNNNNNTQNLYIVDGNVMCISSISVQEPTEMITPD